MKNPVSLFFDSLGFFLMLFFTFLVSAALAQSPYVSFNTDGSIDVKNDIVYLQSAALLDLAELYHLPDDPNAPQGIQMIAASPYDLNSLQYGPNGRIEVRVYDYDEENKKKGALIYAATGTKTGWSEDNWDASASLFNVKNSGSTTGILDMLSSKVVRLLNASKKPSSIHTTNIKLLSQFEGVGSTCIEPGGSGIFAYGFMQGAFLTFVKPLNVILSSIAAQVIAANVAHIAVTAAVNAAVEAANAANDAVELTSANEGVADDADGAISDLYSLGTAAVQAVILSNNAANSLIDNYNQQNHNTYVAASAAASTAVNAFNARVAEIQTDLLDPVDAAQQVVADAIANVAIANQAANAAAAAYAASAASNAAFANAIAQGFGASPDFNTWILSAHLIAFIGSYGAYLTSDDVNFRLFNRQDYHLRLSSWPQSWTKWCGIVTPMPPVLIEVAIKNAQLQKIKIPGLPLFTADDFQSASPEYDTETTARFLPVNTHGFIAPPKGYQIIGADFTEQINLPDFPKYDHIKVPDLEATALKEIRVGNWARVFLAGTYERFGFLKKELAARAQAEGVGAEDYFSLHEISQNFISVRRETPGPDGLTPATGDIVDYGLWSLILNKEFSSSFLTSITPEGPFEVNNGPEQPPVPPHLPDHEIFMRVSQGEFIGMKPEDEHPLRVYPNPTQGRVKIQFNVIESSPMKLSLYDLIGNVVYEEEAVVDAGPYSRELNLRELGSSGMFIISITTHNQSQLAKIIVE
ncbi:MAG: T9SS type A sorting domain-containing protein [Bacteroidota bacterium]